MRLGATQHEVWSQRVLMTTVLWFQRHDNSSNERLQRICTRRPRGIPLAGMRIVLPRTVRLPAINLLTCILLAAWSAAGCRSDQATTTKPTPVQTPVTATAPATGPAITSASPATLVASPDPQTITITGTGFRSDLSLVLNSSAGAITLSGAQIVNVTSTSFQAIATVALAGNYTFQVTVPSRPASNVLATAVHPPSTVIGRISPTTIIASPQPQVITLSGASFQNGLTLSVTLDGGSPAVVGGADIMNVTPTFFEARVTVAGGHYTFKVTNPDATTSNIFGAWVNATAPTRVLSVQAVSPEPIVASPNAHTLTISGTGFQDGLSLTVTDAAGSVSTFTGGQIMNLTLPPFLVQTSFQANVTLAVAGNASFTVTVPGARAATPLVVPVLASFPPPGSVQVTFVSSSPAPGGEVTTVSPNMSLTFSVLSSAAIPGAQIEVDLFDAFGQRCSYSFSSKHDIVAGTPAVFTSSGGSFGNGGSDGCTVPTTIASVKATLVTLTGPGAYLTQTVYAEQSFPLTYAVHEYPQPPAGVPPAPPAISSLTWATAVAGCGGCDPIPDDPVDVTCIVKEADGAGATVTITVTWDGAAPQSSTKMFAPGATSTTTGARFSITSVATGQPRATTQCSVMNDRGETAMSTVRIGG